MTARRILCAVMTAIAVVASAPADAKPIKKKTYQQVQIIPHPPGCPARAFCACGAAVRIFGSAVRSLWPVSAWNRFAVDRPAPGNVAIERGRSHVYVLEAFVSGTLWEVSDYNSGGHLSRRHVRDIRNAKIVNPHSAKVALR